MARNLNDCSMERAHQILMAAKDVACAECDYERAVIYREAADAVRACNSKLAPAPEPEQPAVKNDQLRAIKQEQPMSEPLVDRKNIYVASSWRNPLQPAIVHILRRCGHEVYDFRNPVAGNDGFSWRSIHPDWENWTPQQYRDALEHPVAKQGFNLDMDALRACDTCILLLPSGRSASFEFGWAIGAGKKGAVIMLEKCEPELMYSGNPILTTMDEVFDWAGMPQG